MRYYKTKPKTHTHYYIRELKADYGTPVAYIIAGSNGSGKTTFARDFLPQYAKCLEFVNADLIASGLSPFYPDAAVIRAGKILTKTIRELAAKRKNFGFETTLSGKSYLNVIKWLKRLGYKICLYYLWLPNADIALMRIKDRVQRGGHNIPEHVVRRRFDKGIKNLVTIYGLLLDSIYIFDNSNEKPILCVVREGNKWEIHKKDNLRKIINNTGLVI